MASRPALARRTTVAVAMASLAAGCSLLTDLSGLSDSAGTSTPPGAEGGTPADARADGALTDAASPLPDAALPDGGAAYVAAILADSPLAYYPLEESSGSIATDVVGGKNATWIGGVKLGVAGAVGAGASLDGQSTRLEMPVGSFGFAGKVPYTIEVWLNPAIVGSNVRFVLDQGSRNAPSGGYQIYFNNDFFLCSRSSDAGADGYGNITPPPVGQFVHLAMTYDGDHVYLYANGEARGPANGVLAIPTLQDGILVFGDSAVGQFFKLAGVLDEIAIYDKALSQARVLAHYQARPR